MVASITVRRHPVSPSENVLVCLIRDRYGRLIEPANDFLREGSLERRFRGGSPRTYGEGLVSFYSFLENRKKGLHNYSDWDLNDWMTEQVSRGCLQKTIQARLNIVFRYSVWLSTRGFEDLVMLPNIEYPKGFIFRISSRPAKGVGSADNDIVSALKAPGKLGRPQLTPTTSDVARLSAKVASQKIKSVGERNGLFVSWFHDTAIRRIECVNLSIDQIPSYEELARLTLEGETHSVRLDVTKGADCRWVDVLPDLLQRTREYIDGTRQEIIEKSSYDSEKGKPSVVFLSNETGQALHLRTVSNIFTSLFSKIGLDTHLHRIRATSLSNMFEAEYETQMRIRNSHDPRHRGSLDFELILINVARRAGHRDKESLRPYLTILKKRFQREAGAETSNQLSSLIASKHLDMARMNAEISTILANRDAVNLEYVETNRKLQNAQTKLKKAQAKLKKAQAKRKSVARASSSTEGAALTRVA